MTNQPESGDALKQESVELAPEPESVCVRCDAPIELVQSTQGPFWRHASLTSGSHPARPREAAPAATEARTVTAATTGENVYVHVSTSDTPIVVSSPRYIEQQLAAKCEECGHRRDEHRDDLAGICIGCPCSGFKRPAPPAEED